METKFRKIIVGKSQAFKRMVALISQGLYLHHQVHVDQRHPTEDDKQYSWLALELLRANWSSRPNRSTCVYLQNTEESLRISRRTNSLEVSFCSSTLTLSLLILAGSFCRNSNYVYIVPIARGHEGGSGAEGESLLSFFAPHCPK